MSLEKKKTKNKTKKDLVIEDADNDGEYEKHVNGFKNPKLKVIDEKYNELFIEAGIERKKHAIYETEPNGACGFIGTGLHCHQDGQPSKRSKNKINVKEIIQHPRKHLNF